jgi:uncharacterized OB-fold protein
MTASLPPRRRTPAGAALAAHAGAADLVLPRCRDCGTVQYPVRERCRNCLGDGLEWTPVPDSGTLLSWTRVHASVEPFFREHAPWPVGRVKLSCGPACIVHLGVAEPRSGMAVRVRCRADRGGSAVLVAVPAHGDGVPAAPVDALSDRG